MTSPVHWSVSKWHLPQTPGLGAPGPAEEGDRDMGDADGTERATPLEEAQTPPTNRLKGFVAASQKATSQANNGAGGRKTWVLQAGGPPGLVSSPSSVGGHLAERHHGGGGGLPVLQVCWEEPEDLVIRILEVYVPMKIQLRQEEVWASQFQRNKACIGTQRMYRLDAPHSTEPQNTCFASLKKCLLTYFWPATAVTVAVVMGGYSLVPWSGVRSVVSAPPRTLAFGSASLAAPPPGANGTQGGGATQLPDEVLGVAQPVIQGPHRLLRDLLDPVVDHIAAPIDLHLHHRRLAQARHQLGVDRVDGLQRGQREGDPFVANCPEPLTVRRRCGSSMGPTPGGQ